MNAIMREAKLIALGAQAIHHGGRTTHEYISIDQIEVFAYPVGRNMARGRGTKEMIMKVGVASGDCGEIVVVDRFRLIFDTIVHVDHVAVFSFQAFGHTQKWGHADAARNPDLLFISPQRVGESAKWTLDVS